MCKHRSVDSSRSNRGFIYVFDRQPSKEAVEALSDDMDLNLRGLLRSLEPIFNTDNVRLVEEAIPHSSSRRTNSVVHTGGSAHTELSVREGLQSSHQEESAADLRSS